MKCSIKTCVLGGVVPQLVSADIGFTVLRVYAGIAMAVAHGWFKVPVSQKFIDDVGAMGFPAPSIFAWGAALSEFAGGLLLAAGLFTRPAAFFILGTMLVAAFVAHGSDPWFFARVAEDGTKGGTKEFALLYAAIALAFLLAGSGRFSVDALIRR